MSITIKANFNKQGKDSKKELMQFYVKGSDENRPELNDLCREVVELKIDGVNTVITSEFAKMSKDSKKTVLDFVVKGDTSAAQTFEFYKRAGTDVELTITESQMSIEEFHEAHEGISGRINHDGTVEVDENQMSIDDIEEDEDDDEEELPFADIEDGDDDLFNVTDINEERMKRAAGEDDLLGGE